MNMFSGDRRNGFGRKSDAPLGALLLFLVSGILLLSSLYAAEASLFRKARESVLEAAAPILPIFSVPAQFLQDVFGNVEEYFFVLEQNKSLREEIDALRQWEREARDLREVIAAYEALGYYVPPPDQKPVNAVVIGESNDAFVHTMVVNVGRNDNVAPGQAVVDDRGLVGRIVHAAPNASRVLLLKDVQSNVPVYVEESEVEGILAGRTKAEPAIDFTRFDDLDRVQAGQRVLTSGAGGTLPRGLAVGTVSRVTEKEARVRLDANYARTRIVRVIKYQFPLIQNDTDGMENVGDEQDGSTGEDGEDVEGAMPQDADIALGQATRSEQPAPLVPLDDNQDN